MLHSSENIAFAHFFYSSVAEVLLHCYSVEFQVLFFFLHVFLLKFSFLHHFCNDCKNYQNDSKEMGLGRQQLFSFGLNAWEFRPFSEENFSSLFFFLLHTFLTTRASTHVEKKQYVHSLT